MAEWKSVEEQKRISEANEKAMKEASEKELEKQEQQTAKKNHITVKPKGVMSEQIAKKYYGSKYKEAIAGAKRGIKASKVRKAYWSIVKSGKKPSIAEYEKRGVSVETLKQLGMVTETKQLAALSQMQKQPIPQQAPKGYKAVQFTQEEAMRYGLISRETMRASGKTVTLYIPKETTKTEFLKYAGHLKEKHFDVRRDREKISDTEVPFERWENVEKAQQKQAEIISKEPLFKLRYVLEKDFLGIQTLTERGVTAMTGGDWEKRQSELLVPYARELISDKTPAEWQALRFIGNVGLKVGTFQLMSKFKAVSFGGKALASTYAGYEMGTALKMVGETGGKATPEEGKQIAEHFARGFLFSVPAQLEAYTAGITWLKKPITTYQMGEGAGKGKMYELGKTTKTASLTKTRVDVYERTGLQKLKVPKITKTTVYKDVPVKPTEYARFLESRGELKGVYYDAKMPKSTWDAYFDPETNTIHIKAGLSKAYTEQVMSHELMHWTEPRGLYNAQTKQMLESRAYKWGDTLKQKWYTGVKQPTTKWGIKMDYIRPPTKVGTLYGEALGKTVSNEALGIGRTNYVYAGKVHGQKVILVGMKGQISTFKATPETVHGYTLSTGIGKYKIIGKPTGDIKSVSVGEFKGTKAIETPKAEVWKYLQKGGGLQERVQWTGKAGKYSTDYTKFFSGNKIIQAIEKPQDTAGFLKIMTSGKTTPTTRTPSTGKVTAPSTFGEMKAVVGKVTPKPSNPMMSTASVDLSSMQNFMMGDMGGEAIALARKPKPAEKPKHAIPILVPETAQPPIIEGGQIKLKKMSASAMIMGKKQPIVIGKTKFAEKAKPLPITGDKGIQNVIEQNIQKTMQGILQQQWQGQKQAQGLKTKMAQAIGLKQTFIQQQPFDFTFTGFSGFGLPPLPKRGGAGYIQKSKVAKARPIPSVHMKTSFKKTLLADLLSVTISQAKYGKATHPVVTRGMWKKAEKSLFLNIPTVEMSKRKKSKSLRSLI